MFTRIAYRVCFPFAEGISYAQSALICAQRCKVASSREISDRIFRESSALSLLAEHENVQIQTAGLPKTFLELVPDISSSETVVIASVNLKSLLRKSGCSILLVDDASVPLFKVEASLSKRVSSTLTATSEAKPKVLKLRASIDDHMLAIKVKQSKEFLQRGHALQVVVRLPYKDIHRLSGPESLPDSERNGLQRMLYEANLERFLQAYKECSSRVPKVVGNPEFKEFTLVFPVDRQAS